MITKFNKSNFHFFSVKNNRNFVYQQADEIVVPPEGVKTKEKKKEPETPEELMVAIIELDRKYEAIIDAIRDTTIDINEILNKFTEKILLLKGKNKDNPEALDLLQTAEDALQDLQNDLIDAGKEFKIDKVRSTKRLSSIPELFRKFGLVFENREITFDELNQYCKEQIGKTFFEAWHDQGLPCPISEEEFKKKFRECVNSILIGDYSKEIAIATALAEEANFEQNSDGSLVTKSYIGMNMPHKVVLKMLNELFKGVQFDEKSIPHGIGHLKIDLGAERNTTEIRVDFDNKTIVPPLKIKDQLGNNSEITFDHLMIFFNQYLSKDRKGESLFNREGNKFSINSERTSENAMNIFLNTPRIETIFHEVEHAFYDNNPDYRKTILDKVKRSTLEQRECAVLFTACGYDALDPDAQDITRDIVIDEAYNAYSNEGRYDVATMMAPDASLNIGRFCERYNVNLSLSKYRSIGELGMRSDDLAFILTEKEMIDFNTSESGFIQNHPDKVLEGCSNFKLLRELLIEQRPDIYKKIQIARKQLVDWVDTSE